MYKYFSKIKQNKIPIKVKLSTMIFFIDWVARSAKLTDEIMMSDGNISHLDYRHRLVVQLIL